MSMNIEFAVTHRDLENMNGDISPGLAIDFGFDPNIPLAFWSPIEDHVPN